MEVSIGEVEGNWIVVIDNGSEVLTDVELHPGDEVALIVKRKKDNSWWSPFWMLVVPWLIVIALLWVLVLLWIFTL